jgi:hypothetical protein
MFWYKADHGAVIRPIRPAVWCCNARSQGILTQRAFVQVGYRGHLIVGNDTECQIDKDRKSRT